MRDVSAAGQGAGRARARVRGAAAGRRSRRCRTCIDPTAADEDEVLREVGDARQDPGRDHLALAGERIDMERGARLCGSRFAYLRGDLVHARARARALGADQAPGPRLRAGHPARPRARGGAVRHRLPARHRAADLPPARGRPVPRRHQRGRARLAARRRDPRRRCRCATPASRPASGARRAPRARTRAGSSACTSSTRSRCSRSSRRRTPPTSTSACWRSRRRSSASCRSPTAS